MIVIGRIGATFGVHGWLKIQPFTEFAASILDFSPWYLSSDETNWEKTIIEDGRLQNDGETVLAKFNHINSPEAARLLTGKYIAIKPEQLPKLPTNQYYWSDLKGLTVINKSGVVFGKIIYLMETGSNDVLVVKGEKEMAIPYLPGKVVLSVDLNKQEMIVDWEPI